MADVGCAIHYIVQSLVILDLLWKENLFPSCVEILGRFAFIETNRTI